MAKTYTMRSAFCVINNPEYNIIYELDEDNEPIYNPDGMKVIKEKIPTEYCGMSPEEICESVLNKWVQSKEGRTGAVCYCISVSGLHHLHCVFECGRKDSFALTALKKLFPKIHAEATRGNRQQAEDYINKRGTYAEKGESVVCVKQVGEIKGRQGNRSDLSAIDDLIKEGKNPREIMEENIMYRRYENIIKSAYFDKRLKDSDTLRTVTNYWHVGTAGSGKTYTYIQLCEKYGRDNIFMVSDYDNGMFDNYAGQKILFLDEFKGQMPYSKLLIILDSYTREVHARYHNVYSLWDEVHITSVFPPEGIYKMTRIDDPRNLDTLDQLLRRLDWVVYHNKDKNGFHEFRLPAVEYVNYDLLKESAERGTNRISDNLPFGGDDNEDNKQLAFDF